MSKPFIPAVCLVCGVEFDPRPKPMIINIFGEVVKWWPVPHMHELEAEGEAK